MYNNFIIFQEKMRKVLFEVVGEKKGEGWGGKKLNIFII